MANLKLNLPFDKTAALHRSLMGLDGFDRVIDGTRVVREYYVLGALRLDIAKNARACERAMQDFDAARRAIVMENAEPGKTAVDEGDPNRERCAAALNELAEREFEIELNSFPRAKLNLDENEIPLGVLVGLDPLLVD